MEEEASGAKWRAATKKHLYIAKNAAYTYAFCLPLMEKVEIALKTSTF